jgi:hypothetical protein
MKKALEAYEKAAEWFEGDNAEAYVSFALQIRTATDTANN